MPVSIALPQSRRETLLPWSFNMSSLSRPFINRRGAVLSHLAAELIVVFRAVGQQAKKGGMNPET